MWLRNGNKTRVVRTKRTQHRVIGVEISETARVKSMDIELHSECGRKLSESFEKRSC